MYPKEFFIEQFADISTSELLQKLSRQEMADNARAAIIDILVKRGLPVAEIDELARHAHKASLRASKGTTECDFCICSAKNKPVFDGGQRFCSINCLQAARICEAAVDLSKAEIEQKAVQIRTGNCPCCHKRNSPVEIRYFYTVMSFVAITRYVKKNRLCCVACGRWENLKSFLLTFFLGWWGIPLGILMTPVYLIANIGEMFERRREGEPSDELLRIAEFELARAALQKKL